MRTLFTCVAVGLFTSVGLCADQPSAWPQFRGPGGSGVADGQKPPIEFGPDKNVKWKVPAPSGLSSPITAGDKLVITAFVDGKLYTIAYNRADGKEAWRAQAPAEKIEPYHKTESSPASSTPATDGKRIVSYFGSCGLFCYDLSGKELWRFELPTAMLMGNFGTGVSPIIADGMVILLRDVTNDAKIMAVDLATGSLNWQKKRLSKLSYGTPVVWETPAGKQVVAPGHARLIGYDLKSGDEKWSVAGIPSGCCNSPAVAGGILYFAGGSPGTDEGFKMPTFDDLLKLLDKDGDGAISREEAQNSQLKDFFDHQDLNKDGKITRDEWDTIMKVMSEGKDGAFAVKAGGAGDVTKSHVLWKKTKGLPHVPSALVYRGQHVMVRDGGIVTAYDIKTGKELYRERAVEPGKYYASPVAANGHIYFTSLDDGTVTVLKAGSDRAEVVAKNPKLAERVSATPAIADDTLYVRTAGHLYAFAENAKPAKKTVRAGDGLSIVCDVSGEGDTALVFLHGWCGDRAYWKHQAPVFAADYRVVALDQAGHGDSGKNRKVWSAAGLAADVEAVIKALDLKRVILVGHSMGGPVALLAAKRLPGTVVGVIGVDTLQNAEFKWPEETAKKFLEAFAADFKGTMRAGFDGMLHEKTDPDLKKWIWTRAEAQDQTMALGLMRDLSGVDAKALLKDAKVPVRCINSNGGFKFFTPTAVDVNKKYADFNAVLIEGVGHYPMLEKPAEFNQKLREVLKEFAPRK
jgi:outer membrane protein assembly factor BamB